MEAQGLHKICIDTNLDCLWGAIHLQADKLAEADNIGPRPIFQAGIWVFLHCIYGGLWLLGPHPTPLATFRRKCELDQHFRRKHELKPVVCETCGHKAKNPYELSNHTYRTHGDHDAYLAKRRQWKANGKLKRAALNGGEWRNLHHNYQTYNSRCQLVFKTGLASWQGRIAIPGIFCLEKKAFPLQRTTNHKN